MHAAAERRTAAALSTRNNILASSLSSLSCRTPANDRSAAVDVSQSVSQSVSLLNCNGRRLEYFSGRANKNKNICRRCRRRVVPRCMSVMLVHVAYRCRRRRHRHRCRRPEDEEQPRSQIPILPPPVPCSASACNRCRRSWVAVNFLIRQTLRANLIGCYRRRHRYINRGIDRKEMF